MDRNSRDYRADQDRQASKDVLDANRLRRYRQQNIPVAFDPQRLGWVPVSQSGDVVAADLAPLRLRPWVPEDLDQYHRLLDDPILWETLPETQPQPFTRDIAEDLLAVSTMNGHHIVRAIEVDGLPVGQVRVTRAAPNVSERWSELSYWIGRAYWGQGIASEAVRQMLEAHEDGRALFARVLPDNAASAKVLAKAGFTRGALDEEGWVVYTRSA